MYPYQKGFQNFLILGMIVILPLSIPSRVILVALDLDINLSTYIFQNVLRSILSHKKLQFKRLRDFLLHHSAKEFLMNSFKNTYYLCFFRSYTLPRGCKSEDVTSNLSADGVLMITAAKKKSIQEASRKVPIEMNFSNV